MSTRSFIGFVTENGEFTGNYCHYDGYPEHVGKILVEHHNSFSAAEAIAAGPQIRNFDHDGTICRFGDGDTGAETYRYVQEALDSGYDYAYIFSDADNCWKCFSKPRSTIYGYVEEQPIPGNTPWE
jgi:hypothetical protein